MRLSGFVGEKQGYLAVNNPIYAWIFDLAWVDARLAELRPYNYALSDWIDNSEDRYLLSGKALQEALTWSLNKSLADIDYQFLVASQNLAQKEVRDTLTAVETASKLLATARKQARKRASKQKLSRKYLGAISLSVVVLTILFRSTGILQTWEWNLLDRFFRWRLGDNLDSHITVITIDERDIQTVRQWPIPDGTLAEAIENLQMHQPKAIALDIYRDLPVEPGNKELLQLFNSNKQIYVVEKVVGDRIFPPPISQQQVGFSDRVLDSDGKVRRALLSLVGDDGQTRFSLGTRVAIDYLQDLGIESKSLDGNRYSLGKAVFKRFNGNDGGYVRADAGGYQILLNYWGTEANFQQYSLTKVLTGEIATADIRDRLIFIGSTAESIKDSFYTPYSKGWFRSPQKMPGVFIQANTASQTIRAAIGERPILRARNQVTEFLWILFYGVIPTLIIWIARSRRLVLCVISFATLFLIAICYQAFLLGWWLPLIPSAIALWGTAITITIVSNKQRDRFIFEHTLNFLLSEYRDRPLIGKIALEYLKQSENRDNQILIERSIQPNHKIIMIPRIRTKDEDRKAAPKLTERGKQNAAKKVLCSIESQSCS